MQPRLIAFLLLMLGIIGCGSSSSVRRSDVSLATIVMPVRGIMPYQLQSNFGVARDGGSRSHHGLDIMAPEGREVLAITSGKIDSKKWNNLGGNTLWLAGDDGMIYYYAHLHSYREGIQDGTRVRAGEVLGYVGKTGNASTPHLHFEVHQTKKSPAIDPFTLLAVDDILVLPMPIDSMRQQIVTTPKPTKRKK
ncbi:MAG TPA: M23 family metallopeptidase [Candidatus Kapabacteria bacterium]|nr:M23 family metallopeptidase [Candidatus Kapabacteria bacterium]